MPTCENRLNVFQSSPRIAAGRVLPSRGLRGCPDWFQSSPRIAAGRVRRKMRNQPKYRGVSILAPHRCGARLASSRSCSPLALVSILAPHRCGARPRFMESMSGTMESFNPRPASLRGASTSAVHQKRCAGRFNPRPASLRGASKLSAAQSGRAMVSILAPHRCGARRHLSRN